MTSAVGKTFRQLDETNRGKSRGNKGALGQIIEESVLGYPINSNPQADIKVGDERYELKTTPVRHVGPAKERRLSAKERLVLDIINYMTLPAEAFSDSAFWRKSKNIIVVCYLDDRVDRRN
ncbi:MutH/Sau3AI family endonuclease [Parascardovia denticolens]|uniref:MutH/Sau3AI family endonuclease n=1 Tax=Parascardovia denticolens TaxID=78258 RepID=UPI00248F2775|nr:MutH/Sau3AI family endonuclease [Parascardovia denticolens]